MTATLTWVNEDGSHALNPPKCVIVMETAWAEYNTMNPTDSLSNNAANNGLHDPEVNFDQPHTTNPDQLGYDRVSGVNSDYSSIEHYSVQDGSSGTITGVNPSDETNS